MDKLYKRNMVILTILIFLCAMLLLRLLLLLPCVKQFIIFFLSFTDNVEYKVAFIELCGAIIGSFIAIYGALWTQRKINESEKTNEQKKYTYVVYYDLDFAFKDLIEIFNETKRNYKIDEFDSEETVEKFCEVALGRKLHLNQNWIVDVSQLYDILTRVDLRQIYKCYGKLIDIDRAMQSNNVENIKKVFVKDICWLVNGNSENLHSDIQALMNKLNQLL